MPDQTPPESEDHYYSAHGFDGRWQLEDAVTPTASPSRRSAFTGGHARLARAIQDLQRYDEAIAVAQQITE